MLSALKVILEIQELDIKMIQLMSLKLKRKQELDQLNESKSLLNERSLGKTAEIQELKTMIKLSEGEHADILAKIKKLEHQQSSIKKVDEYNALNQEISSADRERVAKEQKLSDFYDKLAAEEDLLKSLQESIVSNEEQSKTLENEIRESVKEINEEGKLIKKERDSLVKTADFDVFKVYERLLNNKKDRVVVPLENRCCSGCHIMLTAQHENLVRKGERLVFCEHCSRIHFWQDHKVEEEGAPQTKTRRRRAKA